MSEEDYTAGAADIQTKNESVLDYNQLASAHGTLALVTAALSDSDRWADAFGAQSAEVVLRDGSIEDALGVAEIWSERIIKHGKGESDVKALARLKKSKPDRWRLVGLHEQRAAVDLEIEEIVAED